MCTVGRGRTARRTGRVYGRIFSFAPPPGRSHVRHAFRFLRRPHRRPRLGTPGPRKAPTRAKGCDGAGLLSPTHMEWTWPHSLTHSHRHTRHTTDTKGSVSVAWGVGNRRNNRAAAGLLHDARTGAASSSLLVSPPPPRPCPELLHAPRLMTASRAEPHARDRTEWGVGHVLPLPLGGA